MARKTSTPKIVEALRHDEATRKNIPTAEYQPVVPEEQQEPVRVAYERRNRDLDPQLVWRGKDEQDWSDLVVQAAPLYIQEKIHPKALIDDLMRGTQAGRPEPGGQLGLFADFNGLPEGADRTEFYQHDQNWSNRMILGDSLQVMASLAEREGLRGKVQCIYIDPPYGIRFNSNFQWSTTSRDVKDGSVAHITREPEQVKAFRDTWRDGIHSYLTYLRDRLTVARDLLTESGSIFVQIGEQNVHLLRGILDEVFGADNFIVQLILKKTGTLVGDYIESINDYVLWYGKRKASTKYRMALKRKVQSQVVGYQYIEAGDALIAANAATERQLAEGRLCGSYPLHSQGWRSTTTCDFLWQGRIHHPGMTRNWKVSTEGLQRVGRAGRILCGASVLRYKRYFDDFPAVNVSNNWDETYTASDKVYVVQTSADAVGRCLLMATDPGDLVLDPTCGSGTTAFAAEQWGRRWITIDTSRVALALARARVMGARYPYYLLGDSREGQLKEAEVARSAPSTQPVHGDLRHGFVYERVQHITLKSIASNAEIDVLWEKWQAILEPLRDALNRAMQKKWEEWEIPREAEEPWISTAAEAFARLREEQDRGQEANAGRIEQWLTRINAALKRSYTLETLPARPADPWPEPARELHAKWWEARIARQKEIDASIAAKAEYEYLYDKPYEDNKKVRVAGPFTVESLSPHRVLGIDENDELMDGVAEPGLEYGATQTFAQMILENLRVAGVQQAHKEDRITLTSLTPWPGDLVCAEGRYLEGSTERRAGIFIGPEFGTVTRPDLVDAAREAADAGFDVLISCAFSYEAHATEFKKLGRIPVLKATINADLHMGEQIAGKGNLFVIFGEPDIELQEADGGQIGVKVNGVDVFHPQTGEVRSDGPEGIACWFIDTNYNGESFFVRHAYFLGANDPYGALKTTLRAEIDEDAWATLHSDTSRPFDRPESGRIAVKVINHLGDEVMKVFRVK